MIAFCGGEVSLALIRQKDLHQTTHGELADLSPATPALAEPRLVA